MKKKQVVIYLSEEMLKRIDAEKDKRADEFSTRNQLIASVLLKFLEDAEEK